MLNKDLNHCLSVKFRRNKELFGFTRLSGGYSSNKRVQETATFVYINAPEGCQHGTHTIDGLHTRHLLESTHTNTHKTQTNTQRRPTSRGALRLRQGPLSRTCRQCSALAPPPPPGMLPACLRALQGIAGAWPRTAAVVTTALSLLGGALVFYLAQDLSAIDALCLPLPIELAAARLH